MTTTPAGLTGRGLRSASVSRVLRDHIASRTLAPGQALPPERHLAVTLGVSRSTVRRALDELERDGVVDRQPGRGTFVSEGSPAGAPLSEEPDTLMSLTELGAARGLVATARVLEQRVVEATVDDSERFGVAPGAPVLLLRRVRMFEELPVSLDTSRVPLYALPELDGLDFECDSLYAALDRTGHPPVRADYTAWAASATVEQAALLDVAPGAPLLQARTVSRSPSGRVVEVGEMLYRADRYRFRAVLTRRP